MKIHDGNARVVAYRALQGEIRCTAHTDGAPRSIAILHFNKAVAEHETAECRIVLPAPQWTGIPASEVIFKRGPVLLCTGVITQLQTTFLEPARPAIPIRQVLVPPSDGT